VNRRAALVQQLAVEALAEARRCPVLHTLHVGCGAAAIGVRSGELEAAMAEQNRGPSQLVPRERLQHEQREGDKWWRRARTWKALAKRLRSERDAARDAESISAFFSADARADRFEAERDEALAELKRVRLHWEALAGDVDRAISHREALTRGGQMAGTGGILGSAGMGALIQLRLACKQALAGTGGGS
jgi:hypothetical protein